MKKEVEKNRNVRNRFYASSPSSWFLRVAEKRANQTKARRFLNLTPPLVTGDGAHGRERRVRNCKRASFADLAPREIKP